MDDHTPQQKHTNVRKALLIAAVAMVTASPALAVSEDEAVFQVLALAATSIVAGGKCNLHATDVAFLKTKAKEIASAVGLNLDDDQVQLAAAELIPSKRTIAATCLVAPGHALLPAGPPHLDFGGTKD